MVYSIRIAIFLCIIVGCLAQVPGLGGCPHVDVMENFDADKYLGLWYEAEKYPFIFSIGGKCITAKYEKKDNETDELTVKNRQTYKYSTTQISYIEGSARIVSSAKLSVKFPSVPFGTEAPYWILGTDYKNYAVVYSCTDFGNALHTRIVWILTRERNPAESVLTDAYKVMDSKRVTRAYLTRTDQTNCKDEKYGTI